MKSKEQSIASYIGKFSGECRRRLILIYKLVRKIAPESEESISYGMPAFKLGGKPLIYFAGYSQHTGLYALPSGHAKFREALAEYKHGKGSVQFPHDQKLPIDLIEEIVRFRVSENLEMKKSKPAKKSTLKAAPKKTTSTSKLKIK